MEERPENDGIIDFVKGSSFWYRAFSQVFEWEGKEYFAEDDVATMRAAYLPREFYAHELLNVDPADTDSLLSFVSRWGFVYDPMRDNRYIPWPGRLCRDKEYEGEAGKLLDAHNATNVANGLGLESFGGGYNVRPVSLDCERTKVPEPLKQDIAEYYMRKYRCECVGWTPRVVSVAEASAAVKRSQQAVRSVLSWIVSVLEGKRERSDFPLSEGWAFANGVASNAVIPANAMGRGCFLSAVFDQLCTTLLSSERWKICANDECRKPFKRKQVSPNMPPKTGKESGRVKYCCEKCRNSQGNRNKKIARAKRIDHGI